MLKVSTGGVIAALILFALLVFFGAILLNIPDMRNNQGLPLYPAFLVSQVALLSIFMCAYGFYQLLAQLTPGLEKITQTLLKGLSGLGFRGLAQRHGRVYYTDFGRGLFQAVFVGNWWAAICFLIVPRRTEIADQPLIIAALCGAVLLIGCVMLYRAVLSLLSWLRYGTSYLQILPCEDLAAPRFLGEIVIASRRCPVSAAKVYLAAFERCWTSASDTSDGYKKRPDRRDSSYLVYQERAVRPKEVLHQSNRLVVPFEFPIVEIAPHPGAEIVWVVVIELGKKPGRYFKSKFELSRIMTSKML